MHVSHEIYLMIAHSVSPSKIWTHGQWPAQVSSIIHRRCEGVHGCPERAPVTVVNNIRNMSFRQWEPNTASGHVFVNRMPLMGGNVVRNVKNARKADKKKQLHD